MNIDYDLVDEWSGRPVGDIEPTGGSPEPFQQPAAYSPSHTQGDANPLAHD
jgi:hypothetical protein